MQRRQKRMNELRAEIEKKHGKSVEEHYEEREKRVRDAIELKEPDRVLVTIGGGPFAAKYYGVPLSAAYDDIGAQRDNIWRWLGQPETKIN